MYLYYRRPRDDAVPIILQNCPSYVSNQELAIRTKHATTEGRRETMNNELQKMIDLIIKHEKVSKLDYIIDKIKHDDEPKPSGFARTVVNDRLLEVLSPWHRSSSMKMHHSSLH